MSYQQAIVPWHLVMVLNIVVWDTPIWTMSTSLYILHLCWLIYTFWCTSGYWSRIFILSLYYPTCLWSTYSKLTRNISSIMRFWMGICIRQPKLWQKGTGSYSTYHLQGKRLDFLLCSDWEFVDSGPSSRFSGPKYSKTWDLSLVLWKRINQSPAMFHEFGLRVLALPSSWFCLFLNLSNCSIKVCFKFCFGLGHSCGWFQRSVLSFDSFVSSAPAACFLLFNILSIWFLWARLCFVIFIWTWLIHK